MFKYFDHIQSELTLAIFEVFALRKPICVSVGICTPQTSSRDKFRNARPGETGDRNVFRLPGYQTLDLGLSKNFTIPRGENHKFQFPPGGI